MVTPATRPTAYTGISAAQPRETYVKRRSPLPSDFQNYFVGDRWVDIVGLAAYTLVGKASGVSTWQPAGGAGGGAAQFTTNNAAIIAPVAGNINLFGNYPSYGIQTKNGAAPGQIDIQNVRELGRYVVSAAGTKEFTTIQTAINQAVLDGVSAVNPNAIWVLPGIYNESITLAPGISVIGFQADGRNQGIIINGICSQTNGTNSLENLTFANNAATVISCASTTGAFLFMSRCSISNPAATGVFIGGPANTTVFLADSVVSASTIGVHVLVGTIISSSSQINATTAIQLENGSSAILDNGNIALSSYSGNIVLNATSNLAAQGIAMNGSLILNGTSLATITHSFIQSVGASTVSIAIGAIGTILTNVITSNSGSGDWAIGTGTLRTDGQNSLLGADIAIDGTLIITAIPVG